VILSPRAHDWSHFYFDFILDALSGCKSNCRGCGVQKISQRLPTSEEFKQMYNELVNWQSKESQVLDHLEIGPTDFMTADNFNELFENLEFIKLTKLFRKVMLSTTLESENYKEKIEFLKHFNFEFYLVLDPIRVLNEEKWQDLQFKINEIRTNISSSIKWQIVFNSHPQSAHRPESFVDQWPLIVEKISCLFLTKPWHAVSSTRKGPFAKHKDRVRNDIKWLNAVFENEKNLLSLHRLHFQYGSEIKPTNKAIVWHSGQYFWPPVLYGHMINYDEKFKISDELSFADLNRFEERMLLESYQNLTNKPNCQSCDHVSQCAQQGVLYLMDALSESHCIAPKKAYDHFRFGISKAKNEISY
jgi:hypothetical protein